MSGQSSREPNLAEIATAEKDANLFSGYFTRQENPDIVLRSESAGKGVMVYEELLRDAQVASQLQIRSLALQGCEWQVDPASDSVQHRREAQFVEKVLKEANFDRLTNDLMQAVITGYKPVEIMWQASEGQIWVSEFRARRPSRFVFDMQSNLRMLTTQNSFDGETLPPRKFFTWSFGGYDHNPYGTGLGFNLYWPCHFKKHDVKFWLTFCEKFGSPTVVGKYQAGTGEGERDKLLAACAAIQQETAVAIPDGQLIEFLEAKRAGNINSYKELCDYLDRSIAKVILGTPLYSEMGASGMGSAGMAQVLGQVRQDLLKADADSISETINSTVIRWLVDYNFSAPSGSLRLYPKVWRQTVLKKDLKQLVERDKRISEMGFSPSKTYIEGTYGIQLARDKHRRTGMFG